MKAFEDFEFVTDTATLVIFDLKELKHRLLDDADWWSVPAEELREVNEGHAAFFNLGADGRYRVRVSRIDGDTSGVSCRISCPSGNVYIGAGEEVTSDGLEPDLSRGGKFLEMEPGNYQFFVKRIENDSLLISLKPVETAGNSCSALLRV